MEAQFFFYCILIVLCVASAVNFDEDDFVYKIRNNVTSGATTNTYAQAINYGKTHPTRDGASWSGW